MEFEWDPAKARDNEAKHKVSFSEATEVFADSLSSSAPDPDHSLDEERFVIFGRTLKDRYLVVAFTDRGGKLRLISAREMTRRERQAYEQ
ncbi:MAG: BrnT family toxin [Candidatus Nanopelagicales bacterium]